MSKITEAYKQGFIEKCAEGGMSPEMIRLLLTSLGGAGGGALLADDGKRLRGAIKGLLAGALAGGAWNTYSGLKNENGEQRKKIEELTAENNEMKPVYDKKVKEDKAFEEYWKRQYGE